MTASPHAPHEHVDPPTAPDGGEAEVFVLPTSFAQRRLWFLDQLEPGQAAYNVPINYRLTGALDVGALAEAFSYLVARHETLRTVFEAADGEPMQVVLPPAPVALAVEDLRALPEAERERVLTERVRAEGSRPFDLGSGPVMRAVVVRLADEEHALLVTLHHIAMDGWSFGILLRELSAAYAAFAAGKAPSLSELPIQYADYAVWQQEYVAGGALDEQLAYWRAHLAGPLPTLELPTDRPRRPGRERPGGVVTIDVSSEVSEALLALGREASVTPFVLLLAAYDVLLHRYTGQEDLIVGAPIIGRTRSETEGLIGLFLNSLAVRADLSGAPSFRAVLARVREAAHGALAHQDVPFEQVVDAVQPERDRSVTPVFQTMFSFQDFSRRDDVAAPLSLPGITVSRLGDVRATAKFDLQVTMSQRNGAFRGTLEYDAGLFDAATAERLARHFVTLLGGLAAEPDRPIAELPLLDAVERHQALVEWNDTALDYPRETDLAALVRAQVARTPNAPAATFGGVSLSYAELDARADRLAGYLRARGVTRGAVVALYLERSLDMVVALLAIHRAGAAYLPLDPAYPHDRLEFMLSDSGAGVLVTEESLRARLPVPGTVVSLDGERAAIDATAPLSDDGPSDPDRLAYLIYTSGSTGTPKGVAVAHRNVVNFLVGFAAQVPLDAQHTLVAVTPLSFDIAGLEIFLPLISGARVVVAPREVALDPVALAALLDAERATHLQATPVTWRLLVESGWTGRRGLTALCGGEALPPALAGALLARGLELWNLYGPTEATIWATMHRVTPEDVATAGAAVPIGRPMANVQVYVLDTTGAPSPVGVPGELLIGGVGVAVGYHDRPELSAERFVVDPFADVPNARPNARLYRTGDRARWRADGVLEFLGRFDHQVKLRGHRIELGEIETALAAQPGVAAAVALVREDTPGDARLVAYVVPNSDGGVTAGVLRDWVRARLPEIMVPAAFVFLPELPLTANGKVDRRALPAPTDAVDAAAVFVEPSTTTEIRLAAIWGEVLGLDRVGATQSFFDLGGHSLTAMRIVSRVHAAFGARLPLATLFDEPTIARVAALLDAQAPNERAVATIGPAPRSVERRPTGEGSVDVAVSPASFAQRRLWFLDQLEPGRPAYNVPLNYRLTGALDAAALASALTHLVARHEALRTVFDVVDGEPLQVVLPPAPVALPVDDLRALSAAEREQALAERVREEGTRPFDLHAGPIVRARLVRLTDEQHVLLLTTHHIAVDAWSFGVIQRELGAAYAAYAAGREPSLPSLPIQYADYAAWQREYLDGGALDAQLAYWRERLAAPLPALELPTDRPRLADRERTAGHVPVVLSTAAVDGVVALGRDVGATSFTVLLAAFQLLLQRHTGQDDIIVGSPVSGRTHHETEELVGLFMNTLALRTSLDGVASFRALLERVRETVHGALAHQDLPFERLVEAVQPTRDRTRNPIFQALFSVQNRTAAGQPATPGLAITRAAGALERAKFDVQLVLAESAHGVRGVLEYDADLFDAASAERLARQYETLVQAAVAAPDAPLGAVTLLDEAERRLVVDTWNDTPAEDPSDATAHALVAAQCARTPHAVAVRHGDASLTYAELQARAAALASRLRAVGVGPDARVAICADRSIDMTVAVLGVLMAGGAYVPVDLAYPPQRVAYMLDAAAVRVVLTQRHLVDRLPPNDAPVLLVDAPAAEPAGARAAPVDGGATPDHLAYVIYTSGSTGQPKGVAMPHRPLVNLLAWQQRTSAAGQGTPTLQFSSLSFDVSFQELFATWTTGGTLVLVDDDERRDPHRLFALLVRERVERLFLPYVALQGLADVAASAPDAGSLREIITAGEQLRVTPSVRAWLRRLSGCALVNQYGPTESHVVTALALTGDPEDWPELPAIGRPIDNARVYVLDAAGALAPVGASGELYLGGLALARGYLGAPERTAERFVPDPFADTPDARMYRTGDLARWRAGGVLEYIGRADGQVKIRGHRVELGEVEVALAQSPQVAACAVLAAADAGGGQRLVAYVVPATGHAASAAELRTFCRARLPDYMVPSVFVPMDALPLTPSGKVDRRSLPAADEAEPLGATDGFAPPRTTIEHELVHIWESLLSARPIGIHDDFFALGGHSLLAVRMLHEIERVRGRRLPLAALFEHSTIEAIAYLLESAVRDEGEPPVVVLQGEGSATPLVFVHGDVRGGGWYCRKLAPMLGADTRLIVLPTIRPGGPDGAVTIEDMAAVHIAHLREVQPRGPYRLGGYCHGGLVALEMARQLQAAGETIERLVVVDTASLNARFRALEPLLALATLGLTPERRVARRAALLARIGYYRGRIRAVGRMPLAERLRWVRRIVGRRLPGGAEGDGAATVSQPHAPTAEFQSREGTAHLRFVSLAQGAYMPGRYTGEVDVVWSTKLGGNPRLAWKPIADAVRVHRVESSHVGLITYDLPVMGALLRDCLAPAPGVTP